MEIVKDLLKVNFTKGRVDKHSGRIWDPDVIVDHVTQGTAAGTDSWFEHDPSDVSSHYHIAKVGEIKQYVNEDDTAYANGRVSGPTAQIVLDRPGVNPNLYTISIEHEGSGNEPLTPAQKVASVWLHKDIASRRPKVKLNRLHVLRHQEIYDKKTCPGRISVDELVKLANTGMDSVIGLPIPINVYSVPKIVWSDYFNDYVVVTKYVNDSEWYFQTLSSIKGGIKAQTPLSQMKLKP